MENIDLLRKTDRAVGARAIGEHAEQPRQSVAQQRAARKETDILAMPVASSYRMDLQVTDPTDPNFGKFYFMPGLDSPDDPTKVLR